MNVSLPPEVIDQIVLAGLKDHLPLIKESANPPMYSYDPEEDRKEVRKLRKAFQRVIKYYGGTTE
jgi:hypothetical protein